MKYYLAIDQGTTGTTAALIDDQNFNLIAKSNFEFPQHYPSPGLVEHDLEEIWESLQKSIKDVFEKNKIDLKDIKAIGITNQRETTCAFTKNGRPLAKAIVWQDRRTSERCKGLKKDYSQEVLEKTGLPIDPYFSGSKMEWLLKNNGEVQEAMNNDNCLFGTIDCFLIYRLTNCKSFVTESSNASRTLLYNINEGSWDESLASLFSIPLTSLPEVKNSFDHFGTTDHLDFLPNDIPITGCLGDQQAALFGQTCFEPGESKCTYGTGAFFLLNTGTEKVKAPRGLLNTIAFKKDGKITYAIEGSSYIAGAAVQWLRDNLGIISNASDVEDLALKTNTDKMHNILFLPFFTGIASPYWITDAQAAITGLTRDSGNPEMARACLEGIAMAINDLLETTVKGTNIELSSLRVDGGACANNLLMQIQANISQITIQRPEVIETTAYGAALAAAVGIGDIKIAELKKYSKINKEFNEEKEQQSYFSHKKELWSTTIKKLY